MGKLSRFQKIESVKNLKRYKLPIPQTIFIFDFKRQEKEIDDFLKKNKIVTIRSDKIGQTNFCPHNLRCPRDKAKRFIKELIDKNFAVLLQEYIPIARDRVSGNILILKKHIFVELMGPGPLTRLTRDGLLQERAKFLKSNLKETEHFGKRMIKQKELVNIVKLVKNIPPFMILEFTLRPEGIYFWQITNDKTAGSLEKIK